MSLTDVNTPSEPRRLDAKQPPQFDGQDRATTITFVNEESIFAATRSKQTGASATPTY
jgi:hypothetical protein